MATDGGGWMLALNYVRGAGSSPALFPRSLQDGFPLLSSTSLGVDESYSGGYSGSWGHASAAVLSQARCDWQRPTVGKGRGAPARAGGG